MILVKWLSYHKLIEEDTKSKRNFNSYVQVTWLQAKKKKHSTFEGKTNNFR